jgi:hypothetical protein
VATRAEAPGGKLEHGLKLLSHDPELLQHLVDRTVHLTAASNTAVDMWTIRLADRLRLPCVPRMTR